MSRDGELVVVGDVHLERGDPSLADFLEFLDRVGRRAARIVFMGDLFHVWIGDRGLEQAHHAAVLDRLRELRGRGVVVRYLEGNRDYRIGPCYAGSALDDATPGAVVERFGGRAIYAVHGDLVNPADRQYRAWRRLSRSAPVWWLFRCLPPRRRARLADALEARMRGTNLGFKSHFPEREIRAYAAGIFARGYDALVLGHFHVEKDLRGGDGDREGRILVLPEWKGTRRHLRVTPAGEIEFVDSA